MLGNGSIAVRMLRKGRLLAIETDKLTRARRCRYMTVGKVCDNILVLVRAPFDECVLDLKAGQS
jgi:hypothetical protein